MTYRRLPIIVLVIAVLVTGTATKSGAEDLHRRRKMLHLLNQVRSQHGLPRFRVSRPVSTSAWRHSRQMASDGRIYHTQDLYRVVRSYDPHVWGENVGVARYLMTVRRLWMHSPGHRANILKRAYRRVGIGVVKASGSVWVTTIFYGR